MKKEGVLLARNTTNKNIFIENKVQGSLRCKNNEMHHYTSSGCTWLVKFCPKIDFAEVFTWQLGESSLGNFSEMAALRVHLSGKQIEFLLV